MLRCAGKSLVELRRVYFELLHEIFSDAGEPTARLEHVLQEMLGASTTLEMCAPPAPYFMCTTTRVDLEPQQLMLVRYSHYSTNLPVNYRVLDSVQVQ